MSSRRMTACPKFENLHYALLYCPPHPSVSYARVCKSVSEFVGCSFFFCPPEDFPAFLFFVFFFSPSFESVGAENSLARFQRDPFILSTFYSHTHTHSHSHTLFLIPINPLATLISTFVIRKLPRAPYISAVFHFLFCSSLLPRGDTYSFISPPLISHWTGNGD